VSDYLVRPEGAEDKDLIREVTLRASGRVRMARSRQGLRSRAIWFGVGAVLNYVLIAVPFEWLASNTQWPVWANSAFSVGVATAFLFAWNVLVNFRSERQAKAVLPRYLVAVVGMWLLSSVLLTVLKHIDLDLASRISNIPLDFDVLGTQCFLAGLKFTLYHKWVFRQ
jgi:hypothetical protein